MGKYILLSIYLFILIIIFNFFVILTSFVLPIDRIVYHCSGDHYYADVFTKPILDFDYEYIGTIQFDSTETCMEGLKIMNENLRNG